MNSRKVVIPVTSGISEPEQAFEEIGRLEEEIRIRLAEVERRAKDIIAEAEEKAADLVRQEELRLDEISNSLDDLACGTSREAAGSIASSPTLPHELFEPLALELFDLLVKGEQG
ncbi:MAG: hypothetical protein HYU64_21140 [Armatimonadetes bacterium]|nr:hypothetical protein [Armatimonadota bacterium]